MQDCWCSKGIRKHVPTCIVGEQHAGQRCVAQWAADWQTGAGRACVAPKFPRGRSSAAESSKVTAPSNSCSSRAHTRSYDLTRCSRPRQKIRRRAGDAAAGMGGFGGQWDSVWLVYSGIIGVAWPAQDRMQRMLQRPGWLAGGGRQVENSVDSRQMAGKWQLKQLALCWLGLEGACASRRAKGAEGLGKPARANNDDMAYFPVAFGWAGVCGGPKGWSLGCLLMYLLPSVCTALMLLFFFSFYLIILLLSMWHSPLIDI